MKNLCFLGAICLTLFACQDNDPVTTPDNATTKAAVVENYAAMVHSSYQDANMQVKTLSEAINGFVAAPSAESLEKAKQAWLASREVYGQTEVYRFYGGPIDDENGPEGQINAWPLDESYIDYVEGNANGADPNASTNIIADVADFPAINEEVITSLNEDGGETNISAGYHAIEFLLWGQDLSTGAGGGNRPYTDYLQDAGCTNGNCDRRKDYLLAVTQLLQEDLTSLVNAWAPGQGYDAFFTSADEVDNSLERILTGMGKLSKGELAGERMYVAWSEKNKEDEHSCFSDNTHRDIVANATGIRNAYIGKYKAADGTLTEGASLYELVKAKDATLADQLMSLLDASVASAQEIQAPFDQEILNEPGRSRIRETIDLLRAQGDKIAEVSALFGFTLNSSDV